MSAFYAAVLADTNREDGDGFCVLADDEDDAAITLVQMRPEYLEGAAAASVEIVRESTPVKPCLLVADLDAAAEAVDTSGGQTRGPAWSWRGTSRLDVVDPEGNVVQLVGDE